MASERPEACKIRRNQTIIEGCYLKKGSLVYISPTVHGVPADTELLHITRVNKDLQKILGLLQFSSNPMVGYSFVEHIARWRDLEIDKLIAAHRAADDPSGESIKLEDVVIPSRGRRDMFHAAKIPKIVEFTHPPFKNEWGDLVPACTLGFVTSYSRGHNVYMIMTDESLDWLVQAASAEWPDGEKRGREGAELPELKEQGTKWKRRKEKHFIVAMWTAPDGTKKEHSSACPLFDDQELGARVAHEVELKVIAEARAKEQSVSAQAVSSAPSLSEPN